MLLDGGVGLAIHKVGIDAASHCHQFHGPNCWVVTPKVDNSSILSIFVQNWEQFTRLDLKRPKMSDR